MRPPGLHRAHVEQPNKSLPSYGGKRRALAQCQRCGATADATIDSRRILWTGLPNYWVIRDGVRHLDCDGRIVAFDTRRPA